MWKMSDLIDLVICLCCAILATSIYFDNRGIEFVPHVRAFCLIFSIYSILFGYEFFARIHQAYKDASCEFVELKNEYFEQSS